MFTHTKKRGYVIVEACIFLPIFIIGIAGLCFMIKYGILYEKAFVTSIDETRVLVRDMYQGEAVAVIAPKAAERRLKEADEKLGNTEVSLVKPVLLSIGTDKVKTWDFEVNLTAPAGVQIGEGRIGGAYSLYFRPFVGKDNSAACFEVPETEEEYQEVWVFPKEGERYHTPSCYIVTSYAQQKILTTYLKSRYSPCKLCHANELSNGSVVYCFTKEGNKYHKGTCSIVEKYVISMDKKDAEAKGYTPCKICGGYKHE